MGEDSFLRKAAATKPVELALEPGTVIGNHRIVSVLGRGGMGIVYHAEDEHLRRSVALKIMPPSVSANEERRKRFMREARLAAAATHPNVATIYEASAAGEYLYLTMELVQGRTLRARLREGKLGLTELCRVGAAIAAGLANAHAREIVHRDVKPDNVMLTEDGGVKLLDFGLAKLLELDAERSPDSRSLATREGVILGTPGYMSPEQAAGAPLDDRGDVFSLGVTLYEAATGQRPFEGETPAETLLSVARDTPPAPSRMVAELSPAFDAVILACLAKDPRERPAARELAVRLENLGSSASIAIERRARPMIVADHPATAAILERQGAVVRSVHGLIVAMFDVNRLVRISTWAALQTSALLPRARLALLMGHEDDLAREMARGRHILASTPRGRISMDATMFALIEGAESGGGIPFHVETVGGRWFLAFHYEPRTMIVGREVELGRMKALSWDGWEEQRPRALAFVGSPGTGKSTLLAAGLDRFAPFHHGVMLFNVNGAPGDAGRPLSTFGRAVHVKTEVDVRDRRASLLRWLENGRPDVTPPEIEAFSALAFGGVNDDPARLEERLAVIESFLVRCAARWAISVFVDDAEHVDEVTLSLVLRLMAAPIPFMVVITCVPDAEPLLAPFVAAGMEVHRFDPLRPHAARLLLRERFPELALEKLEEIVGRAGGNPKELVALAASVS